VAQVDKTFSFNVEAPGNSTPTKTSATGTIQNDDTKISITDVALLEGAASETHTAVFTISLDGDYDFPVTVHYATADGTGKAGVDYGAVSDTFTFAPHVTSKTVPIDVYGNDSAEADKTFSLNLSAPVNAVLSKTSGTGTIQNDDSHLSVTSDVKVLEGNSGTSNANFLVTLDHAVDFPVTVHYTTVDGTAVAGTNYTTTSGDITFAAGEDHKTIRVPVLGNTTVEADKTFTLEVTSTNALFPGDTHSSVATGTILNDDTKISVTDVKTAEGDTGSSKNMVFTVTLSGRPRWTRRTSSSSFPGSANDT